jgi:hypothetical protein
LARTAGRLADRQPLRWATTGIGFTVAIPGAAGFPATCFRVRIATVVATGRSARAAERIPARTAVARPRATTVDRTAFGSRGTALGALSTARAQGQPAGRATQLLPITGAVAAGVVTAFTTRRPGAGRVAASRTASAQPPRAFARAAIPALLPGTFRRLRRGRWPPGCVGWSLQSNACGNRRAPHTEQPFENGTPGCARRQRSGQMIETRAVHRCTHGLVKTSRNALG